MKTIIIKTQKEMDALPCEFMAITGACSFGVKQFCKSIKLKESYAVKEIIELTKEQYGNKQYEEFFNI